MSDLFSSGAAPAPAASGDALFFAVLPDAAAIATAERLVAELRRAQGLRGAAIPPERLHVTLHALGGYEPALAETAARAAAGVRMAPFRVGFDEAMSFQGRSARPLVLVGDETTAGLQLFQRTLGACLTRAGRRTSKARFTPHMTLAYDRVAVERHAVGAISWTVRDFVLVRSYVGQGRHEHLGRWALD